MLSHAPDQKPAPNYWHHVFMPIERAIWLTLLAGLILAFWLPLSHSDRLLALLFVALAAASNLILYHRILPTRGLSTHANLLIIVSSIITVAVASYLFQPYGVRLDSLYVIIVTITGIIVGWRRAVLAAVIAAALGAVVSLYGGVPEHYSPITLSIRLMTYLIGGFLASSLSDFIRLQADQATRQNRRMAFLLDVSATTLSSLDARETLPRLAERIATALPAAYCCILTLDYGKQALIMQGAFACRPLAGWQPVVGAVWLLRNLPRCHQTIGTGQAAFLSLDQATALRESERRLLFPGDVRTVHVLPITAAGTNHGLLIVGDARARQAENTADDPFTLLQTVAGQLGMVMQNLNLQQASRRQSERFAALVEVGRAVGSTLDLDSILEVIHQQLQVVIPSDTYYVALYDQKEGVFDLRIMIDEGQRFSPRRIPLGEGLATWVVLKRQPLLVRHLSVESPSLPTRPLVLGQERLSESWLGVPIIIGENILGLLAVASYQPNAFDDDDVALLSSVAQQAALALGNARQHAMIRSQAERDSLTGVYNHGHLLIRLRDAVERCHHQGKPVSLIMLDIDHFKQYNDRYGHVVGDEVLRLTADAIRGHIRHNDIVGRWGGEEFAVVLPEATSQEALEVAQRIRQALAAASLSDSAGQPLPTPTISQGIATYPEHASDANTLVILADRMLYRAKESGRDTIRVAGDTPNDDQRPT